MSLDSALAVSGSALGAIGLVTTVAARLRAGPRPGIVLRAQRAAGVIRARVPAGPHSSGPGSDRTIAPEPATSSPTDVDATATTGPIPHVPAEPANAPTAPAEGDTDSADPVDYTGRVEYYADGEKPRRRRRSRRDGRTNAELDDELVTSTVLGWFVLWLLATLAIGYVDTEVDVLQILAQIAIAGSLVALGIVVYDITRHRARHVGWMIDLFVVTAAIAAVPLWFHQPWFGQGRFDRLDDWLPSDSSIDVRLDETLKDYGPGIVAHVLVQAAGMAALVAIALYIVATIVRRARGRYGHHPRDRWVSMSALAVTLVGAICASGTAVSVPSRTFLPSSYTTAKAGATVGDDAPVLALRADRTGRVYLLFGRCGDDRILALSIDERIVVEPGDDDHGSFGQPIGGGVSHTQVPAGTGPVTIVFRSSRRYETTVVFPRRPRANRFIPLRTKDTLTSLYKPGHSC